MSVGHVFSTQAPPFPLCALHDLYLPMSNASSCHNSPTFSFFLFFYRCRHSLFILDQHWLVLLLLLSALSAHSASSIWHWLVLAANAATFLWGWKAGGRAGGFNSGLFAFLDFRGTYFGKKTPGVLNLSRPQCRFTQAGKWKKDLGSPI